MVTLMAGPARSAVPGDVVSLPDDEAEVLIAAGSATRADPAEPLLSKREGLMRVDGTPPPRTQIYEGATTAIRLLTTAAGGQWLGHPGDVLELPEEEARQLVAGRYATLVDSPTEHSAG
jgi:hypothetical protein